MLNLYDNVVQIRVETVNEVFIYELNNSKVVTTSLS